MIRIVHLYPKEMNIYGDYGNVIALVRRCEWRKIPVSIHQVSIGEKLTIQAGDILFMGGGQDKGQGYVAQDLQSKGQRIRDAIEDGLPALVICGGYQLFGKYFADQAGNKLMGIGVFDAYTVAGEQRMIGNIVTRNKHFGRLVGFENHSGETFLAEKTDELGVVEKGFGNDRTRSGEGAIYKHAIGTYMHGSFLPKNPMVADWLIEKALADLGNPKSLTSLDDSIEQHASADAAKRPA